MAYHIVKVIPDNIGSTYDYLDEEHIVRDGDFVEIPFGNEANIIFGMVVGVQDVEEDDLDDPDELFSVLRVISEKEYYSTLDEFEEEEEETEESEVAFGLDADLLAQLTAVCEELGMDVATAFRIFAKKMVREKAIPFDVSVSTYYGDDDEDEDDDDDDDDDGRDGPDGPGGGNEPQFRLI